MAEQATRAAFPTTRILAWGTMPSTVSEAHVKGVMPREVRETVALYLTGKIDQWFARKGGGVLFFLSVTTLKEANDLLSELPLAKAGLMHFELTELGPLVPLHYLIDS